MISNPFTPSFLPANTQTVDFTVAIQSVDTVILSDNKEGSLANQWINRPLKKILQKDLELPVYPALHDQISHTIQWEYFQDNFAPPIVDQSPFQEALILLKNKEICPFRAFADYRLSLRHQAIRATLGIPSAFRENLILFTSY